MLNPKAEPNQVPKRRKGVQFTENVLEPFLYIF
jgi:hypothetical protein